MDPADAIESALSLVQPIPADAEEAVDLFERLMHIAPAMVAVVLVAAVVYLAIRGLVKVVALGLDALARIRKETRNGVFEDAARLEELVDKRRRRGVD